MNMAAGSVTADQSGQFANRIIGVILAVIIGGVMIFAGIWVMGEFQQSGPELEENTYADNAYEDAQESIWDAIGMSPIMITIAVIVGVLTILVGALATGRISV